MKHRLLPLLCLCGFVLLSQSCQESREDRYAREAREYTERNCPQTITSDGVVTLDSLCYSIPDTEEPEGMLTYYYSVHTDATGVAVLLAQRDKLYASLLSAIKNNVDMRKTKEDGLTIRHLYRTDSQIDPIFDFRFTKEDYQ